MILISWQLLRRGSRIKLPRSQKAECTPDGYKLYNVHKSGRNGVGTALITRSNIIVKQVVAPTWCSFKLSEWI